MYIFLFSSAWIRPENIYDYVENKKKFESKNRSKKFREAIQEANEAVSSEMAMQFDAQNVAGALPPSPYLVLPNKITLQDTDVSELIKTFEENEAILRPIFNERRTTLDHFHRGMGYDFLTVLTRAATAQQQQKMMSFIVEALAGKEYYDRPIHENLFWKIILPEWVIAILMKQFSSSREEIIAQILKDEQDSFNARQNSFDLSLDL